MIGSDPTGTGAASGGGITTCRPSPRTRRVAVAALWVAAAGWALSAHPWQGPVLLGITETQGVDAGDLLGPLVAAAGTAVLLRRKP